MECFAPGPRSEVGRDAKGDELKGKVATGGFVAALVADETGVPLPFDVRRGHDGEAGIVSADTDNVEKNRLSPELKTLHTVSIEKV